MKEEMCAHLALQEDALRASGLTADEARAAALRQFGNVASMQERCREARGFTWFTDLAADLRFAVRMLAKAPGYSLVVVLTLAFGIATNAQIFAMVNMFFLQPLPVKDAGRLVVMAQRSAAFNLPHGFSFPDFQDYRARLTTVEDLVAISMRPLNFSLPGKAPERMWAEIVSPDIFGQMGVSAAIGRVLLPSDGDTSASDPVVVLSHDFWSTVCGADPAIVGRGVLLNGRPFTVAGVAREGFQGFSAQARMNLWVPSGALPTLLGGNRMEIDGRDMPVWKLMGRLGNGVSIQQARAEVQAAGAALASQYPQEHRGSQLMLVRETLARPDISVSDFTPMIAAFFTGMVVLVLMIACANVANLMLARSATRQREFALRSALGASRLRLIRQMLAESTFLALLAGASAWVLQEPMGALMTRLTPQSDVPAAATYHADLKHMLFVVGISIAAGLAAGLLPALRGSRANLVGTIKQGHGSQGRPEKHRLRNMLVVGQVAMSLVVLVGAGLFLRSLSRAQSIAYGFEPRGLLTLSFDLGLQGYDTERGQAFLRRAAEVAAALPGVETAAAVQDIPFSFHGQAGVWPEVPPAQMKDGTVPIGFTRAQPGYLETVGTPLLRGRSLLDTDRAGAPRVAVINDLMARICWPGQDALGKRFRMWSADNQLIEVVGVVPTGRYQMVGEAPRPFFYVSLQQDYAAPASLLVRARADPAALTDSVRDAILRLDPHLPLYQVSTLEAHIRGSVNGLMPMRLGATLAGMQGAISLFLAVMGLYAVVSYGVTQRTQEIGIRMALGASRDGVVSWIVREGVRLTLVGIAAGTLFALALGFALSKVLFGLPPIDPVVFPLVMVTLLATTALACWWPARRAASIDPMKALRTE